METTWMIQKAAAMGNWWVAASWQQCTNSRIRSPAEFSCKTSNHPGDSAPLQPRFGPLWTSGVSQNLNHLWKGRDFRSLMRFRKYIMAADGDWENYGRFQGTYFEGDWGIIVLCTIFLVSSLKNVSFSYYVAGYLLVRIHIHVYTQNNGWEIWSINSHFKWKFEAKAFLWK